MEQSVASVGGKIPFDLNIITIPYIKRAAIRQLYYFLKIVQAPRYSPAIL